MCRKQQQQLIKLEDAIDKCRKHGKLCMWYVDEKLINFNLKMKIPSNYIFKKLSVVVNSNNACWLIAICIPTCKAKNLLIDAGGFSSLSDLKEHYPQLFQLKGTFDYL